MVSSQKNGNASPGEAGNERAYGWLDCSKKGGGGDINERKKERDEVITYGPVV